MGGFVGKLEGCDVGAYEILIEVRVVGAGVSKHATVGFAVGNAEKVAR